MSRFCPVVQMNVVYLDCMECEEDCPYAKYRKKEEKEENAAD